MTDKNMKLANAALGLVISYDDLLRQYTGPISDIGEGDNAAIDEAYDQMVVAARTTLDVTSRATPAAPAEHVLAPELPADIIESLLKVGSVEWGQTFCQPDEKHVEDFAHSLQITRESFGIEAQETTIHYVCLEGTATILALVGNSPNAPQSARILAGAWNHLVEIAKASAALAAATEGSGE